MDWRTLAACRDEDPELFFPVGTSGAALADVAAAKTVCRACPVTAPCLEWALESGQDAGVWGGASADERRALRRAGGGGSRRGADVQGQDPVAGERRAHLPRGGGNAGG
jgi:WhiB family transcriptional regulator, redox-sensing transcriptional regulator